MNHQLKKSIQRAFEAPEPDPQKKERFLSTLPQPQIGMLQFILIQAAYMRKRSLFFSILLLFPAVIGAGFVDRDTLWIVSALVPFLGVLAVAESARSTMYGMSEFEMSARFSLRSVVLARMSILGFLDFLILCCLIPFCCIGSDVPVLQTVGYLLVPYLLTVNISLWIMRHFRGKEAVYACVSAAVLVSAANTGLRLIFDFVYQLSYMKWWLILAVLLVGAMIHEAYCTLKQTEELAWNL